LYYGARYYDPQLGAFLSPDTLVPDPSRVAAYNRYAYAYNNPLKYNDPSGHSSAPFMQRDLLLSAVGGGAGGAAVVVLLVGVGAAATMVVVDQIQGTVESYPLNPPGHEHFAPAPLPLETPDAPAALAGPAGEPFDPALASFPLEPPYRLPNIVYAGGNEPNNIGAWGAQQVAAQLPVQIGQYGVEDDLGNIRRYDGKMLTSSGRYVEIKASASSKSSIGISSRIRQEIAFDAQMQVKPMWLFVGKTPSSGLAQLLDEHEIPWNVLDPLEPYQEAD
jgi:hypothetical protein